MAAGVLTIFMALSTFSGCKPSEEEQRCSEGVAYLQALEAKSPEAVEEQLRQIEHQHVLAEREQRIRELIDNQNGVWKYFENYVILGDSRAVGFLTSVFWTNRAFWPRAARRSCRFRRSSTSWRS